MLSSITSINLISASFRMYIGEKISSDGIYQLILIIDRMDDARNFYFILSLVINVAKITMK